MKVSRTESDTQMQLVTVNRSYTASVLFAIKPTVAQAFENGRMAIRISDWLRGKESLSRGVLEIKKLIL